jgi:hypothetical protein
MEAGINIGRMSSSRAIFSLSWRPAAAVDAPLKNSTGGPIGSRLVFSAGCRGGYRAGRPERKRGEVSVAFVAKKLDPAKRNRVFGNGAQWISQFIRACAISDSSARSLKRPGRGARKKR